MADRSPHLFECALTWVGARSGPIRDYAHYSREFEVRIAGKPPLRGSAAAAFVGDPALHNPEDLLVAALSACHFLSYAALCARAHVELVGYEDRAQGTMAYDSERKVMRFTQVILHPKTIVAPGIELAAARQLHDQAHRTCFIANSVNFPVHHEPTIETASA